MESKTGAEEQAGMKAVAESEAPVTGLEAPRTREWFAPVTAARYWAGLKNRARAAGEYAALRTRQGVTLFGEPNIGAIKTIVDRC
ncbi:unnamed protein product [Alopecurus aequalis]